MKKRSLVCVRSVSLALCMATLSISQTFQGQQATKPTGNEPGNTTQSSKSGQGLSVPSDAIYDLMTDTFQNSDVCSLFESPKPQDLALIQQVAWKASVNASLSDTITAISQNSPLKDWSKSPLAVTIGMQCDECANALNPSTKNAKPTAYIFHIVTWNWKNDEASKTSALVPALSEWHVYQASGDDTLKFTGIDPSGEPRIYNKWQVLLVGIDQLGPKDDDGTIAVEYSSTVTQGTAENLTDLTALLGALAGVSGTTPVTSKAHNGIPACGARRIFIASQLIIGTKSLPFTDKISYAADNHYATSSTQPPDQSARSANTPTKPVTMKTELSNVDTADCTAPKSCLDLLIPGGTSQLTVDVSGIFDGVLSFQSSPDKANFAPADAIPDSGDKKPVKSTTGSGSWTVDATKLQEFRVAASALTSGAANVEIRTIPSAPDSGNTPAQKQRSGSTPSDNPGVMSCTGSLNGLPCTSTRTFTSNDREWWDVSVGVAIPGVRESEYSIVNNALKTSVTTHTDLYGALDIYPFAWAADKNDWAPHAFAGLPLGYFAELISTNEEVSESIRPLLRLCREHIDRSIKLDAALLRSLERDPLLADRLRRLRTIPGVGPITALTWALEVGDTSRFRSIKQAISYCGLCSAEKSSADKVMRTPISKQRNKHIQQVLVEAARLAPRYSQELALLYEKERQRGNGNRATLAVARKMVALMLAVERRNTDFVPAGEFRRTAAA